MEWRSLIEFVREPDAQIGLLLDSVSMGQLLSVPMIIFGVYLISVNLHCLAPQYEVTAMLKKIHQSKPLKLAIPQALLKPDKAKGPIPISYLWR